MSDDPKTWSLMKLSRKANQHWDMAGLARQDGDTKDEARHTELARLYDRLYKEKLAS